MAKRTPVFTVGWLVDLVKNYGLSPSNSRGAQNLLYFSVVRLVQNNPSVTHSSPLNAKVLRAIESQITVEITDTSNGPAIAAWVSLSEPNMDPAVEAKEILDNVKMGTNLMRYLKKS